MNTKIKKLLEEEYVDIFLAYKKINGFFYPAIFTKENMEELEPWNPMDARYPMVKLLLMLVRQNPDKTFYPLRKDMVCPNMKRTTLKSVLRALETTTNVIKVPEEIRIPAKSALDRMLEIK